MKFTIKRQAFMNHLGNVSRAISGRTSVPILTGIYVEATAEGLILIGSDSQISIKSFLSVSDDSLNLSIDSIGSLILPSRLFNEVVKKLPTDTITFEMTDHLATITSGKAVFKINGLGGELYPAFPDVDTSQSIELPTNLFKQLVTQTIFSASNQEARPMLTGLNVQVFKQYLSAIATDSHRLSKREIPISANIESLDEAVTIPKKAVLELSKIADDTDTLFMTLNRQQVIFVLSNLTVYSRLLDGTYPDTSRLIPTTYQTELLIKTSEFIQALERASLMSHEGKNNVVQLSVSEEKVELSVRGLDVGYVAEELSFERVEGEQITISFNPDYMRDALRSFGDSTVKIHFQSSVRPLLISNDAASGMEHNELLQLLTPIRSHYS